MDEDKIMKGYLEGLLSHNDLESHNSDEIYEIAFRDAIKYMEKDRKSKANWNIIFEDKKFQKALINFLKENLDLSVTRQWDSDPLVKLCLCDKIIINN